MQKPVFFLFHVLTSFGWFVHSSVEVTRSLLTEWVSRYSDGGYFNWVMEYKETGKAIGNISVVKLHENTEAADIGYCMCRAYWGHGLMPEALKGVMAYLFDVVGLNRIAACHDVNNPKSGRVMDKAGMKREGILRAAGKNNLGIAVEVEWQSRHSLRQNTDAGIHHRHLHRGTFIDTLARRASSKEKAVGTACSTALGLIPGTEKPGKETHLESPSFLKIDIRKAPTFR